MQPQYTPWLVALSFGAAIFVAYGALNLTARLAAAHSRMTRYWLFGGALLLGTVIWSIHQVGMPPITAPIEPSEPIRLVGVALLAAALLAAWFDRQLKSAIRMRNAHTARAKAHLQHVATHDSLTDLPNRGLLRDRLSESVALASQRQGRLAVLTLDLDRFKAINDSAGYSAGDEVLREVARRLGTIAQLNHALARSEGDEFVVVVSAFDEITELEGVAQQIIDVLSQPIAIHPLPVHVTPSVGISIFPTDGSTADSLLAHSQEAVRHAKKLGRNMFQFFAPGMSTFSPENLELENDLRRALELRQLQLYYQPKVDVASGAIVGMEALLRWHHPVKGMISPDRFIPIAEDTGLILAIGEWVLREACRQARRWQVAGLPFLRMAVNLSATQFRQSTLDVIVRSALKDAGLDPRVLELELTESSVMTDPEQSALILGQLSSAGTLVAIDDFGKGYSSMSYLQRFPIDKLKIDRSFVRDLTTNTDSAAIVQAVISLAHSLRLKVVAEGVESYGQLDILRTLGCDQYQGYLCSRPMPAADIEALIRSRRKERANDNNFNHTRSKMYAYRPDAETPEAASA